MTGLRIAFLFVAVVAGDYAALMLIDGQLIDFGVAAAICAGSSVAAGLIAYADDEHARRQHELGRRHRKAVTQGRSAIWERHDHQAAAAPAQECPSCGVVRQTTSESTRSVDQRETRLCEGCALDLDAESTRWPVAALGADSMAEQVDRLRPRHGKPRLGASPGFGWVAWRTRGLPAVKS
jgi:hypothetical protein